MITIYVEDPRDPFTRADQDLIQPDVVSSKISADGRWLTFDIDVLGKCFREVVNLLDVNGHHNLSIRRSCNVEWEEENEILGSDSEAFIGDKSVSELDGLAHSPTDECE